MIRAMTYFGLIDLGYIYLPKTSFFKLPAQGILTSVCMHEI